jgi:hypothetical protein
MEKEELQRKVQDQVKAYDIEREARRIELWDNLKHFETPDDVPDIPVVNDPEEYRAFYVIRLIKAGAIPKKDLIDNQVYIGKHRRCTVARWNKTKNKFEYWRYKFGIWFLDDCNHFENDDGFALFVPIKLGTEKDFQPEKIN